MKKSGKKTVLLLIVALVMAGVGAYMYVHRNEESTDDAALEAHTVMISPKVGGYIKAVFVEDNQLVKAGDALMEIDPADYIIRRDKAQAALEAAEATAAGSQSSTDATTISAPSNLTAAQSQVTSAEATWDRAVSDLKRMRKLGPEARSQEQLDKAVADEKTAQSALNDARARVRSAETAPKEVAAAQSNSDANAARVKVAQADLAQAEKDLADTKIVAAMDGHVTKKAVDRGDYVQPGQALGALVGTELWVTANFKEVQLDRIRPRQRVDIKVDAFPDVTLRGRISSIQSGTGARFSAFPPENATGNFVKIVQRVPVKILLDSAPDQTLALGPGMSVVPTVFTQDTLPPAPDTKDPQP